MSQGTARQFADRNQISYIEANTLLQLLVKKGMAKKVGSVPNKAGRGKPSSLYEVGEKVTIELV